MKDNLTEIVCIIDRSGSMGPLRNDTVNGFNSFLEDQKKQDGEAIVSVVLFNDGNFVLNWRDDIQSIKPMDNSNYMPFGSTSLLDAVGTTVNRIGRELSNAPEEDRPGKVIVLIITDGEENSSREFSRQQIADMVKHQQEIYGWEFVYFGANVDAFSEATKMGISVDNAANYQATREGTQIAYNAMSSVTSSLRSGQRRKEDWRP